jgi:hypothetical protein
MSAGDVEVAILALSQAIDKLVGARLLLPDDFAAYRNALAVKAADLQVLRDDLQKNLEARKFW